MTKFFIIETIPCLINNKGETLKLIILLLLSISSFAHARQYIQCEDANSWDHAVINLNGENSTLFLTNRVDAPDEDRIKVVKKLFFQTNTNEFAIYNTNEGTVKETVKIPLEVIGKNSSKFNVILSLLATEDNYEAQREMICFSSIY